jgi:hypothetical protein
MGISPIFPEKIIYWRQKAEAILNYLPAWLYGV